MSRSAKRKVRYGIAASLLCFGSPSPAISADGDSIYQRKEAEGAITLSNVPDDDSFQLFIAAPIAKAAFESLPAYGQAKTVASLATRVARFRDLVASVARTTAIDPRLLHAMIAVESGYNPQAVSPRGAIGLMQLMPATAKRYGITDMRDPEQNILGGARYLSDLMRMFNNDLNLAIAAYNAGENAVLRHGRQIPPYQETRAYVPKVLALYERLGSMAI